MEAIKENVQAAGSERSMRVKAKLIREVKSTLHLRKERLGFIICRRFMHPRNPGLKRLREHRSIYRD